MTKISVITAVLNGEKFIRKTVESVLNQQGNFELEYIIRDGCSTDNTLKILEEYKDKCIIVSQKDGSPQEAINAGMDMATGDIGCWLNADDIYLPGTLQKVVDAFETNPSRQWLFGRCNIINENDVECRSIITLYKSVLGYFYSKNILLCENYINQPATFWKMDLWRSISSLDPQYKAAWDYELWLKMAEQSSAISVHSQLASFRRHDTSISEQNYQRQFNEELNIGKQYGGFLHNLIHTISIFFRIKIYDLLS